MSNTLTSLIPDVYKALDVVSREMIGFIPAVQRDSSLDRVALNQTLRSFATSANTSGATIAPAMSIPAAANQTITNKSMTISRSRHYDFSWTGEEEYSLDSGGPGFLNVRQDQIAQCFRAAANDIENDLATTAVQAASRATGTAGTTPFATTLADSANLLKILKDNGAPDSDKHLIINTTTGAAMRSLLQLTKVNESADTTMLRQGTILDVHGFQIRESAQLATSTAGTGTTYTTDTAGYAVGATALTLITGSGTIVAGDVITIATNTDPAGNLYKYVVTTALGGGVVTIAAPGLQKAISANARAVTVLSAYTPNVGFTRNAIALATRLPAVPSGGDLAIDRQVVTDPRSGISFELALYPGYRMNLVQIGLNWGYFAPKPEHIALLLG